MKFITHFLCVSLLSLGLPAHAATPPPKAPSPVNHNLLARLPVAFEQNTGQADSRAKFLLRAPGYTAFFNEGEIIFSFRHSRRETAHSRTRSRTTGTSVVQISLAGANPRAALVGNDELPGRANYLLGNDETKWRTDVPTFARITATDIYPGIDLTYYGVARDLEYDFIVRPGADPSAIRLRFEGGTRLTLDDDGNLHVGIGDNEVAVWRAPIAYQGAWRQPVASAFVLRGKREVGFTVGDYDRSLPLVIDPVLRYSTFIGGSGDDAAESVWVGSTNVYIVGQTTSLDLPTPGGYRTNAYASNDVFVACFNSNGTSLIFATYLGGSGDEFGNSIAIDGNGAVCVTGSTESGNFPMRNAYQSSRSGIADAFVSKLSAAGNTLQYSSYLGGSGYESGNAVVIGNGGNIYVAGETDSESQFAKKNPFQNNAGGFLDGFVARFNPTLSGGSSLIFSSWIGGPDDERATGIAIDSTHFYLSGEVDAFDFFSSEFPVRNALQPEYGGGGADAWVAKVPLAGSSVTWATFFGGESEDVASSILVDSSGNVYLVGTTTSANLPMVNAQQPIIGGGGFLFTSDAYAAKISGDGTSLLFSTFIGGEVEEKGSGIGVDGNGLIYIAGQTSSSDFPTTVGAIQFNYNGGPGDAFVTKVNPAVPGRNGIVYSTYFGGIGTEDPGEGNSLFATANGDYYLVGATTSTNGFPVINGFDEVYDGGYSDAFVAKFGSEPDLCVSVSASLEPVLVGSNLVYTMRVNNNSRSTFTSVTLTNLLPSTVNYISAAASRGKVSQSGQTITWAIGTLTNHSAGTLIITVQTTTPGSITNVAHLVAAENEINTGNNVDQTRTTVRGILDLTLSTSAAPQPVFASSNLTYTILASNAGPWNATQVRVTSLLPEGSAFRFATTTRGFLTVDDGFLTCFMPVLTNGGTTLITVVVAPQAGLITNVPNVDSFELDVAQGNNYGTNLTTVNPVTEMALTMTSAPEPIFASSNVVYTIAITNRGPSTATSIAITNELPPNVSFVSSSISRGSTSHTNNLVIGTISSMTNAQRVTMTVVARGAVPGSGTNTARLSSATYDPILENNNAAVITTVNPLANLSITAAAAPSSLYTLQPFTATLNAVNTGPSPASNVVVTATAPASVQIVSAISTAGACTVAGPVVTCGIETLATNTPVSIAIQAVPLTPGTKTIQATVTSAIPDPVAANNSASASVQAIDPPRLRVSRPTSNEIVVTWPINPTNFVPEFTPNFSFPLPPGAVDWFPVTNVIVSTNGLNAFTNFLPDEPKTFRLRSQ
jgi:uncharacterized repeat protein (TIGR01451 family)